MLQVIHFHINIADYRICNTHMKIRDKYNLKYSCCCILLSVLCSNLRFKYSKFVNMAIVDDELAPHILTMRIPTPLLKTQNSNLIGNICYH